jgi:hypothetical protein
METVSPRSTRAAARCTARGSGQAHWPTCADRGGHLGEGTVGKPDLNASHRLREQQPYPANWLSTLAACDTTQQRFGLGTPLTALRNRQTWTSPTRR